MALLPYYDFECPWYIRRGLCWDWDWDYAKQHFGDGFTQDEIRELMDFPKLNSGTSWRYWPNFPRPALGRELIKSKTGKEGFHICIDVLPFKRHELTVKTIYDTVIIEGKHAEHKDVNGYISRQFVRKYTLPKTFDSKELVANLSSDCVLTVKAPYKPTARNISHRSILIRPTGPAALNEREYPAIECKK